MRIHTLSRVCLGLAVALASAGVAAQSADPAASTQDAAAKPHDDKPDFAALDADSNGRVSRSEAAAHAGLAATFDTLDADKDDALTRSELEAGSADGHPEDGQDASGP